jgi:hypothetical protein
MTPDQAIAERLFREHGWPDEEIPSLMAAFSEGHIERDDPSEPEILVELSVHAVEDSRRRNG